MLRLYKSDGTNRAVIGHVLVFLSLSHVIIAPVARQNERSQTLATARTMNTDKFQSAITSILLHVSPV